MTGPIILVDDDPDDHFIALEAIQELGLPNEIKTFLSSEDALKYLTGNLVEQPFIIICDVNMPRMNGIALKRAIEGNEDLRRKSIPFVYYSTSASNSVVNEAYELQVQGFFIKGQSISQVEEVFKLILGYWKECRHPHS